MIIKPKLYVSHGVHNWGEKKTKPLLLVINYSAVTCGPPHTTAPTQRIKLNHFVTPQQLHIKDFYVSSQKAIITGRLFH